jgi:hypothetical protein
LPGNPARASYPSLLIDGFRIEQTTSNDLNATGLRVDFAKEAGLVAFMAGRAPNLVDANQDRVGVAVVKDAFDFLSVSFHAVSFM